MTENQRELNEKRVALYERFKQLVPSMGDAVEGVLTTAYKAGKLSEKTKYLLALSIALATGCRICTLAQTVKALEAGATREEILETISVVVAMRGTTGIAESLRVIEFLEDL